MEDFPFTTKRLPVSQVLEILKALQVPSSATVYDSTSDEQRQALVKLLQGGANVRLAAEKCNMKHSTAKSIWSFYRRSGKINKAKKRPRTRNSLTREALSSPISEVSSKVDSDVPI
eukprot:TRINITY_DN10462_c0_g1_i5.p1 TRINITY_DN10462_c0_g1~~TRINITY_DN10462_c0_g1_i5.p1  ORF type:complete len:116 (+),score=16.13 TRINITY_DN10462_c0_g1_i5:238-585(+)